MILRASRIVGALMMAVLLPAQTWAQQPDNEDRAKALALCKQQRYLEALPTLETLATQTPNDAVVQEALGFALMMKTNVISDPADRKQTRLRARAAGLKAHELGDDSQLDQLLLELPEDGSDPAPFSNSKEVDAAMRAAEAAFAEHRYEDALAGYQKALALDPHQYAAALFIGDVYFKMQQHVTAGEWFARAIAIEPNAETAYRYWGDTLAANGEDDRALDRYIDAIVAEPYKRLSWVGLTNWVQRNHKQLAPPDIKSPNSISTVGSGTNITIDSNSLKATDGSNNWMMYEIARAAWQTDAHKKDFPDGKYRHSLREESDALNLVAEMIAADVTKHKIKQLNPALATLLELRQKGLLESYILISRADEGIAQDYDAYRNNHHEQLRQFIREYVIHEATGAPASRNVSR